MTYMVWVYDEEAFGPKWGPVYGEGGYSIFTTHDKALAEAYRIRMADEFTEAVYKVVEVDV